MRQLGIPTVVDRMVQQALHQVTSREFEPGFSESSYGFRPGRSEGGTGIGAPVAGETEGGIPAGARAQPGSTDAGAATVADRLVQLLFRHAQVKATLATFERLDTWIRRHGTVRPLVWQDGGVTRLLPESHSAADPYKPATTQLRRPRQHPAGKGQAESCRTSNALCERPSTEAQLSNGDRARPVRRLDGDTPVRCLDVIKRLFHIAIAAVTSRSTQIWPLGLFRCEPRRRTGRPAP